MFCKSIYNLSAKDYDKNTCKCRGNDVNLRYNDNHIDKYGGKNMNTITIDNNTYNEVENFAKLNNSTVTDVVKASIHGVLEKV